LPGCFVTTGKLAVRAEHGGRANLQAADGDDAPVRAMLDFG